MPLPQLQTEKPCLAAGPHKPDWVVILGIGALHLGALLAFFPMFFSWSAIVVMFVMLWVCSGLGVTLGFHRLLTHRSFKTFKVVEYALTLLGTLNWQGGPIEWVGTHRIHHSDSDGEGDPHSPRHGFTWAHATWCMVKHPAGYEPKNAALDLQRDLGMRIIDKFFIIPLILVGVGFYLIGGWSWVVWGICVRTVLAYHGTWLVNSAAHTWGYRNFKTTDDSRNNFWVALISFGEGWHNNHHAYQRSAAHGMRWWELDLTYITIRLMGMVGLARDIIRPQTELDRQSDPASQTLPEPPVVIGARLLPTE